MSNVLIMFRLLIKMPELCLRTWKMEAEATEIE